MLALAQDSSGIASRAYNRKSLDGHHTKGAFTRVGEGP